MLSVLNTAQTANSVPACKVLFLPNFIPHIWGIYTLYHCKADKMGHADDEVFYLAPLTNIPNFSSFCSSERRLQIHQTQLRIKTLFSLLRRVLHFL